MPGVGGNACLPATAPVLAQMPVQGAVTHLIVAPQGVLRNFYPLSGYCLVNCDDIHIDLFRSELCAVRRGRPLTQVLRRRQTGRITAQGGLAVTWAAWAQVTRELA